MQRIKNFFSLTLLVLLFQSCSQSVPHTTKQMPSTQLDEIREGEALAKKLVHHAKLIKDKNTIQTVKKVANSLILALDKQYDTTYYKWEFFIIEDKWRANAFCLAGGKVFIFSGLFPYLDNEDELALVLAHEMIHVLEHHQKIRKRYKSINKITNFIVSSLIFVNPFSLPFAKKRELKESKKLVEEYTLLPYMQSQEYEADALGLALMKKAGFNPKAGVTFWSKFPQESQIKPEYLSTHPSTKHRLEKINALLL